MAGAQDGGFWRFVTGKVSGNNLEYVAHGQGARTNFTWSGPDGGSLSMIWEKSVNARPYNSSFQRLDG